MCVTLGVLSTVWVLGIELESSDLVATFYLLSCFTGLLHAGLLAEG